MNIEWLKNKTKEKFYPITHAKAVLFGNSNKTLDEEINDLNSSLTSVVNTKIDTINGDAYIGTSKSGTTETITHKDVIRTNTTSTASPSSGSTFTAIDRVTSDFKGHITSVNTKTIILPTTVGTISLIGDVIGSGTFVSSRNKNEDIKIKKDEYNNVK